MSVFKGFRAVINQANEKAQSTSLYPIRRNLCKCRAPNCLVLLKCTVMSDWFYIFENVNIYFKLIAKLKKNRSDWLTVTEYMEGPLGWLPQGTVNEKDTQDFVLSPAGDISSFLFVVLPVSLPSIIHPRWACSHLYTSAQKSILPRPYSSSISHPRLSLPQLHSSYYQIQEVLADCHCLSFLPSLRGSKGAPFSCFL